METLYSLIKIVISPEIWIFVGLIVGCVLSWTARCPRIVRSVFCIVTALYFMFSTRPLTQALVQPLEAYYHAPVHSGASHDAIVLLVDNPVGQVLQSEQSSIVVTGSAHVLLCGLRYVQAHTAPKVVLAQNVPSGVADKYAGESPVKEWAAALGYPREALLANDYGVATHDRARSIKQVLGADANILLIDSPMHLPRSAAVFRKIGFTVTPVPCAYSSLASKPWTGFDLVPGARNLEASSIAVYEYSGLLIYWLRGFI